MAWGVDKFDYRRSRDRYQAEADYLERMRHPNGEPEEKRARTGNMRGSRGDVEVIPPDDDMGQGAGTGTSTPEMAPRGGALTLRSAKGGRTDGSETSVDPIAEVKLRPFHNTQDVIMPFYISGRDNAITSANSAAGTYSFAIRLNSVYDVINATTYTEDPTAAADTADAITQKHQMYDYWTSIYRYWTVTKSEYTVRIWTDTKSDTGKWSVWTYHNGQQQPPIVATSLVQVPDYMRKMHQHAHVKYLFPRSASNTDAHEKETVVEIKGVYYPGNRTVVNDVAEDEFKETWHKVNEVPSQREVATFIVQHADGAPRVAANLHYEIEIVYHVQLKDLKAIYQYPTQESDIPAVTDYADHDI